MRRRKELSRRDFLGLAGMTAVAGGLTCIGGIAGYLIFREATKEAPPVSISAAATSIPSAPAPSSPRPDRLKQIDRPEIITRAEWGAREPNHEAEYEAGTYSLSNPLGWRVYEGDLRDDYETVVVHHSVLIESDDVSTMQRIQREHMDLRGWADVGYHFGVGRSGQVFEGRDLSVRGTPVEHFNTGSVGVVFFGDLDTTEPTSEQISAGQRLIDWLALRLELTHLAGHRQFNSGTDCPGLYMLAYLPLLAQSAGLVVGTGGYVPPPEQLLTPTPPPD
jgi:N-acetylmuramoyl-L-alanine amidase